MHKSLYAGLCVGLLLSLNGCYTLFLGGAAGAGGYYLGKDERSAKRVTGDAAITTSINAKYAADDYVRVLDIDVDTYEGIVTLTGYVQSQQVAQRAIAIAQQTDGVRQVISRLQITTPVPN